jgi:hypothetical protein
MDLLLFESLTLIAPKLYYSLGELSTFKLLNTVEHVIIGVHSLKLSQTIVKAVTVLLAHF